MSFYLLVKWRLLLWGRGHMLLIGASHPSLVLLMLVYLSPALKHYAPYVLTDGILSSAPLFPNTFTTSLTAQDLGVQGQVVTSVLPSTTKELQWALDCSFDWKLDWKVFLGFHLQTQKVTWMIHTSTRVLCLRSKKTVRSFLILSHRSSFVKTAVMC